MTKITKESYEFMLKIPHTCDDCRKTFTWQEELKENPEAFGIGGSRCGTCERKLQKIAEKILEGGGRKINPKIAKLVFGILLVFFILIIYNILDILWN